MLCHCEKFLDVCLVSELKMPTELPLITSTNDSNVTTATELFDGWRTGSDSTDNLDPNMSTVLFDMANAVNLTTAATLSLMKESFTLAISESAVKTFSHIARTYISPIVGIIGFTGNSLGVGVLWRQAKQQKLSIFWYLCTLTMIDAFFLGLAIIDGIPYAIVPAFDKELAKYLIAHFRLGLAYCDITCIHTARYVVLVMSCERLISVVRPLHVKDTWFAKYPGRMMFACVFFNAVFLLPVLILATIVTKTTDGQIEYIFTFKSYDTFFAQYWVVEAVVHSFIPMFFMVAINIAIPVQVYRASAKLRHSRSASSKDSGSHQGKITITVMAITLMYIFLSIPLLVVKILQYIEPDFNMTGKYRLVFWFIADLGKLLAYFNSANDFIVFFVVSNNYRAVFKSMYCKRYSTQRGKKMTEKKYGTDEECNARIKETSSFASKETLASAVSA